VIRRRSENGEKEREEEEEVGKVKRRITSLVVCAELHDVGLTCSVLRKPNKDKSSRLPLLMSAQLLIPDKHRTGNVTHIPATRDL